MLLALIFLVDVPAYMPPHIALCLGENMVLTGFAWCSALLKREHTYASTSAFTAAMDTDVA